MNSTNTTTQISAAEESPVYWTIDRINQAFGIAYFPLIIASLVGNVLIMIVMLGKKDKINSTSVLFSTLALCDIVVTINGPLLSYGVRDGLQLKYNRSLGYVWTNQIIFLVFQTLSSWVLVVITFERLLCTIIPYKVKKMLSTQFALFEIALISLVVAGVQISRMVACIRFEYRERYKDFLLKGRTLLAEAIYFWTGSLFSYVIPLACLSTGSIVIISRLRKGPALSTSGQARVMSVTRNLLAANVTFIITMTPWYIINFLGFYDHLNEMESRMRVLMVQFLRFTLYSNQALNFYIYFMSGEQFRKDLRNLFNFARRSKKESTK